MTEGYRRLERAREAFAATFPDEAARRAHFAELGRRSGAAKRRRKAERLAAQVDQDTLDRQAACPHRFPPGPADKAACTYCDLSYSDFADRLSEIFPASTLPGDAA